MGRPKGSRDTGELLVLMGRETEGLGQEPGRAVAAPCSRLALALDLGTMLHKNQKTVPPTPYYVLLWKRVGGGEESLCPQEKNEM